MRVHYLQHVPFEDLGSISVYFAKNKAVVTSTKVYESTVFPEPSEFDVLIIMGGPMGVYQEDEHPWLISEKQFIRSAIDADKVVLGFCLGSQLLAEVCGASVTQNAQKEVGWFNYQPVKQAKEQNLDGILSDVFAEPGLAFHWHGDTFTLPDGAQHLARSAACENQAFAINNRLFGFQFHLETTPASARDLIAHCANELVESEFVQTPQQLKGTVEQFMQINLTLQKILDSILSHHGFAAFD